MCRGIKYKKRYFKQTFFNVIAFFLQWYLHLYHIKNVSLWFPEWINKNPFYSFFWNGLQWKDKFLSRVTIPNNAVGLRMQMFVKSMVAKCFATVLTAILKIKGFVGKVIFCIDNERLFYHSFNQRKIKLHWHLSYHHFFI